MLSNSEITEYFWVFGRLHQHFGSMPSHVVVFNAFISEQNDVDNILKYSFCNKCQHLNHISLEFILKGSVGKKSLVK